MNMYGLLGDNEAQDYGRWQDAMSAWQGERDYLAGLYDSERSYDYGRWSDDRDFGYAQYRDEVADKQWERQFAEQQRQYNASLAARNSGGGDGDDDEMAKVQKLYNPKATYSDVVRSIRAAQRSGQIALADRIAEAYYNNRPEWRGKMIEEGVAAIR